MSELIAINPDKRQSTAARKVDGFVAEGLDYRDLNQVAFKSITDHVWGTSGQVTANEATFSVNGSGVPKDKNNDTVVFADDDKILIDYNSLITSNITLAPTTSVRLNIGMYKGRELDFGPDTPDKIILKGNIAQGSKINIRGNFKFEETSLSDDDKRLIANQARGVKINYNEFPIYDPARTGEIVTLDGLAINPYLLAYDGSQYDWVADASNASKAWFRDLNIHLGGIVYNGLTYDETRSRFTQELTSAHRFQVNTGYGFLRQITDEEESEVHLRTDMNNVSVEAAATFTNESAIVTFDSITDIKNGMRINGASAYQVLDGEISTTVLKNVNTTTKVATMINALTGDEITATAGSATVTMDNSGAAGGSKQTDDYKAHTHSVSFITGGGSIGGGRSYGWDYRQTHSSGGNETRSKSTGVFFYQRA